MKNNRKFTKTEFTSRKIMWVFALALAAVLLLMFVHSYMQTVRGFLFMMTALRVLALLSIPAFAYGAWRTRRELRQPMENRYRFFTGVDVMVISLVAAVSSLLLVYLDNSMSVKFLYVMIPGLAVLYLIHAIFQREFFAISAFAVAAGGLLWLLCRVPETAALVTAGAGLLLSLLFAALALLLRRGDGAVKAGERRLRLIPPGGEYGPLFITAAVAFALFAAGLVLSILGTAGLCAYLAYILFAYIFILAVYYTVKLM